MVYVVMEVGYEYNDEGYDRAENDGGHPVMAFPDIKSAEAERQRLEDEKRAGLDPDDLSSYCGNCHWSDEDACQHEGLLFYVIVPVEHG